MPDGALGAAEPAEDGADDGPAEDGADEGLCAGALAVVEYAVTDVPAEWVVDDADDEDVAAHPAARPVVASAATAVSQGLVVCMN